MAPNTKGMPGECIRRVEEHAALGFTYLIPSMKAMDGDPELVSDQIIPAFSRGSDP